MSFYAEPVTLVAVPDKQRHLLIVLPEPGVSSSVYALKGMVRYENVEGDAFLQMNNDFGDRGTFFTKSLGVSGPLGKISGHSDWRPFLLPFDASSGGQAGDTPLVPQELTLALHLPGSGTVSIRDVQLVQYGSGENPLSASGQWFSNRSAGVYLALLLIVVFLVVMLGKLLGMSRSA